MNELNAPDLAPRNSSSFLDLDVAFHISALAVLRGLMSERECPLRRCLYSAHFFRKVVATKCSSGGLRIQFIDVLPLRYHLLQV